MARITVIVPVYKVETYLSRCVDSILNQTFSDFELVLVDDGSPDRCPQMCEEYARQYPFIHVIHQENGGLSAARNSGIDWAMAESDSQYLAFVDSDDWVAPEFLEQMYRAAEETGCPIGICNLERTAGEPLPPAEAFAPQVMSSDDYYSSGTVHDGITAVAWNKLYSKRLFEHIRYPVGKLHEDEFTTYRLIYGVESVAVVPARLYAYFQNDQGIMRSRWSPKRMHSLEALEQQIAYAEERNLLRLMSKATERYVFGTAKQLPQAEKAYQGQLRKKLRRGLALGRKLNTFAGDWDITWLYELAYPVKPFWWLVFKIKALTGR